MTVDNRSESSCFCDLYYFFAPPSSSSELAPLFSIISLTRSENFLFRIRMIDANIPISYKFKGRENDKYHYWKRMR